MQVCGANKYILKFLFQIRFFSCVLNKDYLLSKKCNLLFNVPVGELEVLVVEKVVDESEDHSDVGEVPDARRVEYDTFCIINYLDRPSMLDSFIGKHISSLLLITSQTKEL